MIVCMTDLLHTPERAKGGESIAFNTTEALFLSAAIHGYVYRRHGDLSEDKRDAFLLVAIHARKAANAAMPFSLGYAPEDVYEMSELAQISREHAALAIERQAQQGAKIDVESLLAPSLGETIANRFNLVERTLFAVE